MMKALILPAHSSLIRRKAFTLVEVCLALGVVSFSLLSLLGLLPMGMLLMRDAASQTTCSHIVQKIRGDLSLLSTAAAAEYISSPKVFDFQGKSVAADDSSAAFEASFQQEALQYPGSEGLDDQSGTGRMVVTITRTHGGSQNATTDRDVVFRTAVSLAKTR